MNSSTADSSFLFIDASSDPITKVGFGAVLEVTNTDNFTPDLKEDVLIKQFDNTNSTKLELQTLLWALDSKDQKTNHDMTIHTDSQNLFLLPDRRIKLEASKFCNAKGKLLALASEYQQFYAYLDSINFSLVKVKGHLKQTDKKVVDQLFTLVDRASRNALRNYQKDL